MPDLALGGALCRRQGHVQTLLSYSSRAAEEDLNKSSLRNSLRTGVKGLENDLVCFIVSEDGGLKIRKEKERS